jgi:tetratricopeptide (TPR) repeat protein
MLSEAFLGSECSNFVIVRASDTLAETLQEIERSGATLNWDLVVRFPGSCRIIRVGSLLKWERAVEDRAKVRQAALHELDLPLIETGLAEDSEAVETLLEKASHTPSGSLVLYWAGTQMVCGVVTRSQLAAFVTESVPEPVPIPPVEAKPSIIAEEPAAQAAAQTADLPVEAQPPQKEQDGIFGWLDNIENSINQTYSKYRINILVGAVSFLVAVFSMLWTVRNDIMPILVPPEMTGEWNVAVARFDVQGDERIRRKDVNTMSEVFYNRFASEMANLSDETGLVIEVLSPEQTGAIRGDSDEVRAEKAAAKAEKINADVVLYGTVTREGEVLQFKPEFYVDIKNMYEAEEMVGQHTIGSPISIERGGAGNPSQINLNRELSRRSEVMALVTKGLSLYLSNAFEEALDLFQRANKDEYWSSNTGREVLYLFEGNAANRSNQLDIAEQAYTEALEIDDQYARSLVGLGFVDFTRSLQGSTSQSFEPDEDLLERALERFDLALQTEDQPESADIPAKVAFGKAQVYLAQAYTGKETLPEAVKQFERVIALYSDGENPRLQELASEAHARIGFITREQNDLKKSHDNFSKALELSTNPARSGLYWLTLGLLDEQIGEPEAAQQKFNNAIQDYRAALELTTQAELRAQIYSEIARAYISLQDHPAAENALLQAIALVEEDSATYQQLSDQLDSLGN